MNQQIVSLEVAKALKEANYPQVGRYQYTYTGKLVDLVREGGVCYGPKAPSYIDAWLWLWREKNIQIVAEPRTMVRCYIKAPFYGLPLELAQSFHDAEDAIIAGINYLVENDLISNKK